MKFTATILALAASLATLTEAAPKSFNYNGIVTKRLGIKCTGSIHYNVADDAGGKGKVGSFALDGLSGCLGGTETFDDGKFVLKIDRNKRTSTLTEKSSGVPLHGSEGEHQGPVKPCTANVCPPATTMTCIFGAGPDGKEPSTKTCGLT